METSRLSQCQTTLSELAKYKKTGEDLLRVAQKNIAADWGQFIKPTPEGSTRLGFDILGTSAIIRIELQPRPMKIDARLVPYIIEIVDGNEVLKPAGGGVAFNKDGTTPGTTRRFSDDLLESILKALLFDHPVPPFVP